MDPRPCHVRGWWYETAETDPDPMPTFTEMHRAFVSQDGKKAAADFVACKMATKKKQKSEEEDEDEEEDDDEDDDDEDDDDDE